MKALATSFNALIELGDLYEFYKFFISQSTFFLTNKCVSFKNDSTKNTGSISSLYLNRTGS